MCEPDEVAKKEPQMTVIGRLRFSLFRMSLRHL